MEPKTITFPYGDRTFLSTLYYGQDCRETLKSLPAGSVHCVVTSPPYWGLRDYGTGSAQIGLEDTPLAYTNVLKDTFREIRRVLRDDGTVWLNLGDSYSSGNRVGHGTRIGYKQQTNRGSSGVNDAKRPPQPAGIKPKDLVGIPWRIAFALQDDGWYLRQDIIWAKGNPMPESVEDRCTRSHEYLFMLTKNERYFYDHTAIMDPTTTDDPRKPHGPGQVTIGGRPASGHRDQNNHRTGDPSKRNKRSVWNVNPRPYAGAHFATMPPALVEPCVKAGTSEKGCCPACGAPWKRNEKNWSQSCSCDTHEPIPCTVLDPFSGSGTTGYVSNRLGRNYIGLDLNPDYLPLAEARILGNDPPDTNPDPTQDSILDLL